MDLPSSLVFIIIIAIIYWAVSASSAAPTVVTKTITPAMVPPAAVVGSPASIPTTTLEVPSVKKYEVPLVATTPVGTTQGTTTVVQPQPMVQQPVYYQQGPQPTYIQQNPPQPIINETPLPPVYVQAAPAPAPVYSSRRVIGPGGQQFYLA